MRELPISRRAWLAGAVSGLALRTPARSEETERPALVAITLDLEMSRNFPKWEDTHWDYEKGNLNDETKAYAKGASDRVEKHGGRIHFFALGQTFEQPSVDWLRGIADRGHPVGSHTYDHVHMKAKTVGDVQFRFQRAPWLIGGKTAQQAIVENVELASRAMEARLGKPPAGFRTPGGFSDGLDDRPDLQRMLKAHGFRWVSSKYPPHPAPVTGAPPTPQLLDALVNAQAAAQPYVYPETGLIEVPMSPPSDIVAFRGGRWKLEWFLDAIDRALTFVIDRGLTFDFLGHPSCLYVVDPEFRVIERICERVKQSGGKAKFAGLDALADRARPRTT